jgi:hypothetical protein
MLAYIVWATPLRTHVSRALQKTYKTLHMHGDFFGGYSDSTETVFLVGDAGEMTEGVFTALERAIRGTATPPTLIYLGDNIYPLGMPASTETPEGRLARSNLSKQMDPFRLLTRQILFTPGNHDWENHSPAGWDAVRREGVMIEETLGSGHLIPSNGCPGPTRSILTPSLQVIALDSTWWLHPHAKPSRVEDGCDTFTEDTVAKALDAMLTETPQGVETLIILHHPLLPANADRAHTKCPFSPECPEYISMRERLSSVLTKHRPLLCASGHNHALQVHKDSAGCRTYVVSGGGSSIYNASQPGTAQFASAALGFMALSRSSRGDWRLDVIRVSSSDSLLPHRSEVVFSEAVR